MKILRFKPVNSHAVALGVFIRVHPSVLPSLEQWWSLLSWFSFMMCFSKPLCCCACSHHISGQFDNRSKGCWHTGAQLRKHTLTYLHILDVQADTLLTFLMSLSASAGIAVHAWGWTRQYTWISLQHKLKLQWEGPDIRLHGFFW